MKYLIIGANAAGMSAAVRISKFDKDAQITVLEKSDVVSFGACGIPYYLAGEFSDINTMTARSLEAFIKSGMDVRIFQEAVKLNPSEKQVVARDTKTNKEAVFNYDKVMIATGASPAKLSIKGQDAKNVHTLHSRHDAETLRALLPEVQNIVIIGAGFIGLEAAEAFSHIGKKVTLIEFAPRVMARTFDPELTDIIQNELMAKGVTLKLEESVTEIISQNGAANAVMTNKGRYAADLVIMATGFRPNTAFLEGSGVALSRENAVVVDNQGKTNLKDVFSAGDCATVKHRITGDSYIPLATSANKLGRITGEVMAGKDSAFIGTLGSSGIRVFELEAARTGISEEEAKALGLNYGVVFIKDKNRTDYVLPQTDMWVKLIYDNTTRQLLGGQIIGSYLGGAVHRVDALAVAVYSKITVEELGFMDFVYAPPFSRTWDILNVAGNVAK